MQNGLCCAPRCARLPFRSLSSPVVGGTQAYAATQTANDWAAPCLRASVVPRRRGFLLTSCNRSGTCSTRIRRSRAAGTRTLRALHWGATNRSRPFVLARATCAELRAPAQLRSRSHATQHAITCVPQLAPLTLLSPRPTCCLVCVASCSAGRLPACAPLFRSPSAKLRAFAGLLDEAWPRSPFTAPPVTLSIQGLPSTKINKGDFSTHETGDIHTHPPPHPPPHFIN